MHNTIILVELLVTLLSVVVVGVEVLYDLDQIEDEIQIIESNSRKVVPELDSLWQYRNNLQIPQQHVFHRPRRQVIEVESEGSGDSLDNVFGNVDLCDEPSYFNYPNAVNQTIETNTTISFHCAENYCGLIEFSDKCDSTTNTGTCQQLQCPTLSTAGLANARITTTNSNNLYTGSNSTQIDISCNAGYEFVNSDLSVQRSFATLICSKTNDTFSFAAGNCVDCGVCEEEIKWSVASTATLIDQTALSGLSCKERECPLELATPGNGVINTPSIKYLERVGLSDFSCNDGFVQQNDLPVCLSNGNLDFAFDCGRDTCRLSTLDVSALDPATFNADQVTSDQSSQTLLFEATYEIKCNTGYVAYDGTLVSTCQADGTMSPITAICEQEDTVIQESISEINQVTSSFSSVALSLTVFQTDTNLVVKEKPPAITISTITTNVQTLQTVVEKSKNIEDAVAVTKRNKDVLTTITQMVLTYTTPVTLETLQNEDIASTELNLAATFDEQRTTPEFCAEVLLTVTEVTQTTTETTDTQIVKAMESMMSILPVETGNEVQIKTETILATVVKSVPGVGFNSIFNSNVFRNGLQNGVVGNTNLRKKRAEPVVDTTTCTDEDTELPTEFTELTILDMEATIPEDNLDLEICSGGSGKRLQTMSTLFITEGSKFLPNATVHEGSNGDLLTGRYKSNNLISMRLCGADIDVLNSEAKFSMSYKTCQLEKYNLMAPLRNFIQMEDKSNNKYNPCVFRDTKTNTWSQEGTELHEVIESDDGITTVICKSNHLTSFTVGVVVNKEKTGGYNTFLPHFIGAIMRHPVWFLLFFASSL